MPGSYRGQDGAYYDEPDRDVTPPLSADDGPRMRAFESPRTSDERYQDKATRRMDRRDRRGGRSLQRA